MWMSLVAAAGTCADAVAEGLYAQRHRFAARAAALGYAIGAAFAWIWGLVTPISFTVESVTVATRTTKKRPLILYIVALSAVPSLILGVTGLYSRFIEFLEPAVVAGVIGGVGIILTGVAFDYVRERPLTAGASSIAGFGVYMATADLVLVIVAAVAVGTLVHYAVPRGTKERVGEQPDDEGEDADAEAGDEDGNGVQEGDVALQRPHWRDLASRVVIVGALSLFALRLGVVVSYDTVNSEVAGTDPQFDAVMVMSSIGSIASAMLGGPPLETTPASTAQAPQPAFSTGLMMAMMTVITALGLVGRVGKLIPLHSVAGFLLVLGIPVILPQNVPTVGEAPLPGGAALAVTALSNPFYGLVAGQAVHFVIELGLDPSEASDE